VEIRRQQMRTAKWILDSYEEGDDSVRWDLYMVYPDLRGCFDQIDAISGSQGSLEENPVPEKLPGGWYSHCCRLVRG
jgi:hypothetical protein